MLVKLRAFRATSEELAKRWPKGADPSAWAGVRVEGEAVIALDLRSCQFAALPKEIGALTTLTSLDVSGCSHLTALPKEIGELAALTVLKLSGCSRLLALPIEFGRLDALTTLNLDGCRRLVIPPFDAHHNRPARDVVGWLDGVRQVLRLERDDEKAIEAYVECIKNDCFAEYLRDNPSLAILKSRAGIPTIEFASRQCRLALEKGLYVLGRFEVDEGPPIHFSSTTAVVAATDRADDDDDGMPRRALKAMRYEDQVLAELVARVGLDARFVVGVVRVYVDDENAYERVRSAATELGVEVARSPGLSARLQHEFLRRMTTTTPPSEYEEDDSTANLASGFKFLLVLELAERTLDTALKHEHFAGKDFFLIRKIAADIAMALEHVHENGRIHADLKPLNIVRVGSRWRLIDFDVSRPIDEPFGRTRKLPSTGYCPPELAATIFLNERIVYSASVACDLWSLGCVLLLLVSGSSLIKVDLNDDVESARGLRELAGVPDLKALRRLISERLYLVEDDASNDLKGATVLVGKLLEPDEKKRLENFPFPSMRRVLDEPFFKSRRYLMKEDKALAELSSQLAEMREKLDHVQAEEQKQTALLEAINERTKTILGLQRATITKIDRHVRNLCECIRATVDDKTPTAFVILSHPPPPEDEEDSSLEPSLLESIKTELSSAAVSTTTNNDEMLFSKNNDDSPGAKFLKRGKGLISLYNRGRALYDATSEAVEAARANPGRYFLEKLKEKAVDTLYLSLVCEMCWTPQSPAYEVTQQTERCLELMPIAKATFATVRALNGIAGIAQCFFPGVPSIPRSVLTAVKATIDDFDAESSVADFDSVQSVLEKAAGERQASGQVGYCSREFDRFLEKEDPNHEWANLERLVLAQGKSVWVCQDCAVILKDEKNNDKTYDELRALCEPAKLANFVEEVVNDDVEERIKQDIDSMSAAREEGAHDEDASKAHNEDQSATVVTTTCARRCTLS
ncbi:hypothetical protein CTAYLR_003808 [Chrysophaeum taylorii]|uniref:Protein kinase domain-containing protein n=1 Tax=Chrysophaeum taylorii TaxID=2483200 RepID=A0AAD7UEC9_9STRA|nr:hypothetical protein CTAYLR_003808 [Chrysophaeum taylorii]